MDLHVLGRHVRIRCRDAEISGWLESVFGSMSLPDESAEVPDLEYRVDGGSHGGTITVHRPGADPFTATDAHGLLFVLEKDLTIELQKMRRELLFVHAAALLDRQGACLLVGAPGAGKSTLTWALLHRGWHYSSDELAPLEPEAMRVLPFPRALCLKTQPPEPFSVLPASTLRTSRTLHVPVRSLPAPAVDDDGGQLHALLFVEYSPVRDAPALRRLSPAEATARLFVNTLNALSHPAYGVDVAVAVVRQCEGRCFALAGADLTQSCDLVAEALQA